MQILEMDALDLGQALRRHQVSVREALDAVYTQITATKRLNAYITLCPEQAYEQAEQIQKKINRDEEGGPLAGVPMAVKDNISTMGVRTTCASQMLAGYVPPYQATVIASLQAAGAVMVGKTNCDEFAMGSTTETSAAGITRNPWDERRSPGGSSGGSAAAVASRQAWYALGSDTGGSIRQPSTFCNLTGLKPTYGLVSRYGLIAYASSLDQIGPMARSARDCAAVMAIIAGADHRDSTSLASPDPASVQAFSQPAPAGAGLDQVRVALPENLLDLGLRPSVRQSLLAVADQLRDLGAKVIPVQLPFNEAVVPAYYLIASAEASANLARYDGIQYGYRPPEAEEDDLRAYYERVRSEGFGQEVKRRIMLGTFALSSGYYDAWYLKALRVRSRIQAAYAKVMQGFDCLLAPVSAAAAPLLGQSLADPLAMYQSDIFTVAANLTGLPAVAFPCGCDPEGLPIGAQLMGPMLSDARLLQMVAAYQDVTPHHRRPWPGKEVSNEV